MAVWCGQCQTRNEAEAERCIACGALLMPLNPTSSTASATLESAVPHLSRRPESPVERYQPDWLSRLVAQQCPERPDVVELVSRCRFTVRRVALGGDLGRRDYFVPERPGEVESVTEEVTCRIPGRSFTVALGRDMRSPKDVSVSYIETRRMPLDATDAAAIMQYEQLSRDRRALWQQTWAFSFLALTPLLLPVLGVGAGLWLVALLPLVPVYAVFAVAGLRARLDALDATLASLAEAIGLPNPGTFLPGSRNVFGNPSPLAVCHSLLVAISVMFLWFAMRALLFGGAAPWETLVIGVLGMLAYPALVFARRWQEQRSLVAAEQELSRSVLENRRAAFEPWIEL